MAGRERPIVSILDLKAADVEAIEVELGLSVSSWGNAPSMAQLYRLIYEKATGQSAAGLTLRELTDAVALGTETDPNP
jgi:hypothetical protein